MKQVNHTSNIIIWAVVYYRIANFWHLDNRAYLYPEVEC